MEGVGRGDSGGSAEPPFFLQMCVYILIGNMTHYFGVAQLLLGTQEAKSVVSWDLLTVVVFLLCFGQHNPSFKKAAYAHGMYMSYIRDCMWPLQRIECSVTTVDCLIV